MRAPTLKSLSPSPVLSETPVLTKTPVLSETPVLTKTPVLLSEQPPQENISLDILEADTTATPDAELDMTYRSS
jgi:hypothetical protein